MSAPVRLAHLSDLHLALPLSWAHANLKRVLGRLNWILNRRRRHDPARLDRAVEAILAARPDLVLVTGDLGQTGLVEEVASAVAALTRLSAAQIPVLLTDGNHDHYGDDPDMDQTLARARMSLCLDLQPDACGVVRKGEVEILLMQQGRSSPILQAWGEVGAELLAAMRLRWSAAPPEGQTRIAAGHYPLTLPSGGPLPHSYGLRDAAALRALLEQAHVSAYFCGHLHQAWTLALTQVLTQYGAGSVTGEGRLRWFVAQGGAVREAAP